MASTIPYFVYPPFSGGFYLSERTTTQMWGTLGMIDLPGGVLAYRIDVTDRTYEMVTHADCCRDPLYVVGLGTRPLTALLQPGWGLLNPAQMSVAWSGGGETFFNPSPDLAIGEFLYEITVEFKPQGYALATARSNQKSEILPVDTVMFLDTPGTRSQENQTRK